MSEGTPIVETTQAVTHVVEVAVQGPPGPQGPAGVAGGQDSQAVLNVTGLTGGGANNLDGLMTINLPLGVIVEVQLYGDVLTPYRLEPGTNAEASPSVIRPDDYDESTNARVWKFKQYVGNIDGGGYT